MTEIAPRDSLAAPTYEERFRPQFHLSASHGWLGDPDGMIRYRDTWHVFWWGHAVSNDLVHWTECPYPMTGDDGSFVYFSGSVVVDEANTSGLGETGTPPLIAIYTMHDRETGHETQGLSISHDTMEFAFYPGNPVLDAPQPAFRDPQVFWDDLHHRWVMVITLPEERQVHIYESPDMVSWQLLSEWGPCGARSQVWEVPDLFALPVDGDPANRRWVLLCGMFPNRNQAFFGDFDGTRFTLDAEANAYLLRGQGIPGTVVADFEHGIPPDWRVSGHPVTGDSACGTGHSGFLGNSFLSTFNAGGDEAIEITSAPFPIEHPALNFLVAGGGSERTSIHLIVDGNVVRTDHGTGDPHFRWVGWDVTEYVGASGSLQISDDHPHLEDGALSLDHIVLSPHLMVDRLEHANWLDTGPDYYAVRTYRDYDHRDDRCIAMGWMGNWDYAPHVPTSWGKGYLAIPRELSLRSWEGGLRLCQQPIPELASLRGTPVHASNLTVTGTMPIPGFSPRANQYELDLTFDSTAEAGTFGVRLAMGNACSVTIGYNHRTSNLFLDRTRPENNEFSERFARHVRVPHTCAGDLRLRIFVDAASVEVFADNGETTMSAAMFPNESSTGIELFAEGGDVTVVTLTAWELDSIWQSSRTREGGMES